MYHTYFWIFVCVFLMVPCSPSQSQALQEIPSFGRSKASEPVIGVSVNIPLWRLLGKKKAISLPDLPTGLNSHNPIAGQVIDDTSSYIPNDFPSLDTPTTGTEPINELYGLDDRWVYNMDCKCLILKEINDDPPIVWGGGGGGSSRDPIIPPIDYAGGNRPPGMPPPPENPGGAGGGGYVPDPVQESRNILNELPKANTCEVVYLLNTHEPTRYAALMYRNIGDVTSRIIGKARNFTDSYRFRFDMSYFV